MAEAVDKLAPTNALMMHHAIKPQECATMVASLDIPTPTAMKVRLTIFNLLA